MRIQPIQQPTFQMKWESKALPNVTKSKIELANGKKLLIRDGGWYKLQSLYDAGRIGEQLANKQDKCIHIIDTYVNGTSGYRIWSDGFCEQWGYAAVSQSSSGVYTIAFIKTFADTNYSISTANNSVGTNNYCPNIRSYTAKNMVVYNHTAYVGFWWKVSGYLASYEY